MTTFSAYFRGVRARKTYHPDTSLSLAVACDLAYKAPSRVKTVAKGWGFNQVSLIDVQKGADIDTQGYVMANATDIICVFRGSDAIEDWFANFQAVTDPGPLTGTKAHEGFQDALYPAVIAISNAIDSFGGAEKRLWLTGHSLGGALCSLYAGMLMENSYDVYGIYTFASPRPGDDKFAVALNSAMEHGPHFRVVNEGDIVPHVPPEPFFSHPGRRVLLSFRRRESRVSTWRAWRKKIFEELMDMTGKVWRIKSNHVLHAPKLGYIPRLIADAKRSQRKAKS
ncbi:MAG: lipase family protein [Pseudomonadota bacterium]